MAQQIYSLSTLNSNWFEDRHQPAGGLTATSTLHRKAPREYETDLAYVGERYDVLSRISRMPQRESYATPNDGFNEKLRTSSVDFAHPKGRPGPKGSTAPILITTGNAPVCPPEQRPLPGPASGFGAAIHRHDATHDQRFWNTTHGDFFGEPFARTGTVRADPGARPLPSGVSTEHEEARVQGLRTGKLCGEYHQESSDPAVDTRTQRAWLYSSDPALRHIHLGGTRKLVPEKDSELSLPLGGGAMSKIRQDLKERKGRLYRTATHITKGASRAGPSIFQDD